MRVRIQTIAWSTFVVSLLLVGCATSIDPESTGLAELTIADDLDSFIEGALPEFRVVPGMAVAVYALGGSYTRGFGVTDVETGETVTADTAFYTASSTKSFTALTMNILHHRGDLNLDMALADFSPDANFPVAVRPDVVTLRDLLTHTSGLSNEPTGDRLAFTGEHTPAILWELIATSKVNELAPHGMFEYTNQGYNILTLLTDRQLGRSWQALIKREILNPVGMTRSSTYMSEATANGWSVARPHFGGLVEGPVRIRLEKTDATMQSAGGMVMSANDALRWLQLMVDEGAVDGKQIVPATAILETRARLTKVDKKWGPYARDHYGLGWYIGRYRDEVLVHHFGAFAGFRSHISYMPQRKIGVAVFINDGLVGLTLPDVIANYAYDLLTGRDDALATAESTFAAQVERRDRMIAGFAESLAQRAARPNSLTLPQSSYAGTYESDLFGSFDVALRDGKLVFRLGNLSSFAEPFKQPNEVRVEMLPYNGQVIRFDVTDDRVVSGLIYQDTHFRKR